MAFGGCHCQVGPDVRTITPDACIEAEKVLNKDSDYYTQDEAEFFMRVFGTWSQWLDELLKKGAAPPFLGNLL